MGEVGQRLQDQYKERVIDLPGRVCRVSVETVEVVDGMAYWEDGVPAG